MPQTDGRRTTDDGRRTTDEFWFHELCWHSQAELKMRLPSLFVFGWFTFCIRLKVWKWGCTSQTTAFMFWIRLIHVLYSVDSRYVFGWLKVWKWSCASQTIAFTFCIWLIRLIHPILVCCIEMARRHWRCLYFFPVSCIIVASIIAC